MRRISGSKSRVIRLSTSRPQSRRSAVCPAAGTGGLGEDAVRCKMRNLLRLEPMWQCLRHKYSPALKAPVPPATNSVSLRSLLSRLDFRPPESSVRDGIFVRLSGRSVPAKAEGALAVADACDGSRRQTRMTFDIFQSLLTAHHLPTIDAGTRGVSQNRRSNSIQPIVLSFRHTDCVSFAR